MQDPTVNHQFRLESVRKRVPRRVEDINFWIKPKNILRCTAQRGIMSKSRDEDGVRSLLGRGSHRNVPSLGGIPWNGQKVWLELAVF